MRKWLACMVFLTCAVAWAEEEQPGHPTEEKAEEHESVPDFIFHHVSNTQEWTVEFPLKPEWNHTFQLPVWQIDLKPGACALHPEDHSITSLLNDGCLDLSLSKAALMMFIAAILLMLAFIFGAHRNKQKLVPHGASANILEMLVLFIRDEIAAKTIGKEEGKRYVPYLCTIFFFILFMNLLGLIPEMSTATGSIGVTLALALCTFILTQVAGIRAAGLGGYLKHLTGGVAWWLWPIMVPVEILGLFTKPFALTVRLFANMVAGHIVIFFLLGLIFILGNAGLAAVSVPFAMAIYFLEMFVALVQAYIFTILSGLFIGMSVAMGHHDDHGHAHEAEGAHSHDHGVAHHVG